MAEIPCTRLGSVHAQHPDLCEKLGNLIAFELVHKSADSGHMALEQILKMLSGVHIASAIKNDMMLILNMTAALW